MKHLVLLSLFLWLSLTSFSQTPSAQLLKAYKSRAPSDMDSFFDTWKQKTLFSHSALESMDDTVKNIYQVYEKVFNPYGTDSIHHQTYLGIYQIQEVKHLLLQHTITYGIVDTLDRDLLVRNNIKWMAGHLGISVDRMMKDYMENPAVVSSYFQFKWPKPQRKTTINPFYPQVSFGTPQTLMLTKEYNDLIWSFLLKGHSRFRRKVTVDWLMKKERFKFLEEYFRVWNGELDLNSPPYVASITFSRNLENALVDFDNVSSGAYAYLKKIDGEWKVIDAGMTWQH
jgi:hypothetical protein